MRPGGHGACRSEGLVAGEHVPDRLGEPAGDVDLRDFRAALFAETSLVGLVAIAVDRVLAGVGGGFHQRPAQVLRAGVREWAPAVGVPGLVDAGA